MARRRPATLYQSGLRVLDAVLGTKRTGLEAAWSAEARSLPRWERARLRELCSGALRHFHRLDAELSPLVEREAFLASGKAAALWRTPRSAG